MTLVSPTATVSSAPISTPNQQSTKSNHLSAGAGAGIAIGVIGVVSLALLAIFLILKKRNKRVPQSAEDPYVTQQGVEAKPPPPQNNLIQPQMLYQPVQHDANYGQQPQIPYTGPPPEASIYTSHPNTYQYPADSSSHELSSAQVRRISELPTYPNGQ